MRIYCPLLIVLSWIATGSVHAEPLNVEPGVRQLFFDDQVIENISGLRRATHQATKSPHNPVLRRKNDEEFRVMVYGTTVYDEEDQCFKMWYMYIPRNSAVKEPVKVNGHNRVPWVTLVAYATSEDGIHWDLPNLGQVEMEGNRDNNLIDVGQDNIEGISILRNRHSSDPDKKWLAFFWEHHSYRSKEFDVPPYDDSAPGIWEHGMWAAYSPDGIHWTNHGQVIARDSDTHQMVLYDPQLKKYLCYNRIGAGGRKTARLESSDFLHWSESQRVFDADELDPPKTQVYGMSILIYEGIYVGVPWLMYEDGVIDMHLAFSRDGIAWNRPEDRQPLIACGEKGSWDAADLRMGKTIVVKDDTIYMYYCGAIGVHPTKPGEIDHYTYEYQQKYRSMDIGLVTLRRDGWISLQTKSQGTLTTKPIRWPGGQLRANADVADGSLAVALKDTDGTVLAQSKPLAGDHANTAVSLTGKIPQPGQVVTLEFDVTNGDLYSFWWE